jgi:AraC-like DNA-binding protein
MTGNIANDGSGSRQVVHLRPGLNMHLVDFNPRETVKLHFETNASCLRFTFLHSGKGYMDWRVSSGTAVTRKLIPMERSSSISYFPELEGKVCFPAGYRQSHFSIQISQDLLNTYLGGRFQKVPYELQAILVGCNTIDFHHSGPLSPVMDATIHQLLSCPYSGALRLVYQENKAIELIAHKMAQIESASKAAAEIIKIGKDDIRKVRHAKDILMKNIENPPRLADLARAVGTCHTQLNRVFRRVYGTSVFGYLRKIRLEEARQHLEKGSMNVTEAAIAVGYNSISSFSRAFSDHFGTSPLNILKKTSGSKKH